MVSQFGKSHTDRPLMLYQLLKGRLSVFQLTWHVKSSPASHLGYIHEKAKQIMKILWRKFNIDLLVLLTLCLNLQPTPVQ